MIQKRCRKANLSKRVFLNLFRHSEATNTANFLTEAQMRKRHGWSSESRMPSRYVHLVNSDVENAIFDHYGIKREKTEKIEAVPNKCIFCNITNSADSTICIKCGKPMNLESVFEIEDEYKQKQEALENRIVNLELVIKNLGEKFLTR